jgi:hypothetical protein
VNEVEMEQKKGTPVWVWLLALIPVALVFLGVLSALAIYGVSKYMMNAKQAEAQAALIAWGDGLAKCGEKEGGLPPSTLAVPASISAVSARKYQSSPTDWAEQAHTCAGFSMPGPQYFQYRWERRSQSTGVLHAGADLNGDGVLESQHELDVTCGAGKCERGVPTKLASAASAGTASAGSSDDRVAPAAAPAAPSLDTPLDKALVALSVLCLLANVAGSVWLLVLAFQESVLWGLLCFFVPCAQLVFVAKFWDRTRRAFLFAIGTGGALLAILLMWGMRADRSAAAPSAAGDAASSAGATPPVDPARGVKLPPPPPAVPVPELTGAPADLSTVMGKARKLANQWEQDAALVGIDATLSAGLIQTQEGASARLTFGPSSLATARPKTGLFIVTYDKAGLSGAAAKGPASKALPEPMCSPESVYARIAGGAQPTVRLRYAFDAAQRPAWIGVIDGQPTTQPRLFEPQRCDGMGSLARPSGSRLQ